tara:strand:- start:143 stop:442 length:300 start_codon:yes stop_codon:yes gene_type:complete
MKNLEEEISKTLHSIDNIQRADPGPFFYTRLSAKMEVRPMPLRWYWKVAMVALLAFNVGSFVLIGNSNTEDTEDGLNDISSEYLYYVPDYELTFNEDML